MRSAEGVDPAPPEPDPAVGSRRWIWQLVAVIAVAVVVIAFARGTRSELRYQTDPSARPPLDEKAAAALAGDRAGTSCGGWSPLLSTTERPVVAPLHAAVWADTQEFHVRSDHFYVLGVRFDVEGGTAVSEGLEPAASLTVPTRSGQTIDVEISCEATAVTIHLVGGNGKDVGDAILGLGAQEGTTGPMRLAKDTKGPTPAACRELVDARTSFSAALTGAAQTEAVADVLSVSRASRDAMAEQLTAEERADADVLIAVLEDRLAALEAGEPDAIRPIEPDQEAAAAGVAKAFDRVCG